MLLLKKAGSADQVRPITTHLAMVLTEEDQISNEGRTIIKNTKSLEISTSFRKTPRVSLTQETLWKQTTSPNHSSQESTYIKMRTPSSRTRIITTNKAITEIKFSAKGTAAKKSPE